MYNQDDLAYYENLMKRQQEMDQKKRLGSVIGAIADSMGSAQSAGNFWLGQRGRNSNASGMLRSMAPDRDLASEEMKKTAFLDSMKDKRTKMAMGDADSELSEKKRDMWSKLLPGADLGNYSANQLKELAPMLYSQMQKSKDREYEQSQKASDRKFTADQKSKDREFQMMLEGLRQQGKMDLASQKAKQKKKGDDKKAIRDRKQFAKRYANIVDQIGKAQEMIQDKGIYEVFGGHNQKLAQSIDSIAIDAAKAFDPESVARESEVNAFRKMLIDPSMWTAMTTRSSTAKDVLGNFRELLKKRAMREMEFEQDEDFDALIADVNKDLPVPGSDKQGGMQFVPKAVADENLSNVIEIDGNSYRLNDDGVYERL